MKTKKYSLAEREKQFNEIQLGDTVFDELQKMDGIVILKNDVLVIYRTLDGEEYAHTKFPININ